MRLQYRIHQINFPISLAISCVGHHWHQEVFSARNGGKGSPQGDVVDYSF